MKRLAILFSVLGLAACAGASTMTYHYNGSAIDKQFASMAAKGEVPVVVIGGKAGQDRLVASALEAGNASGPQARFVPRAAAEIGLAPRFIAYFEPAAAQSGGAACANRTLEGAPLPGGGHLLIAFCGGSDVVSQAELIVPAGADLAAAVTRAMNVLVPVNDPQWDANAPTP